MAVLVFDLVRIGIGPGSPHTMGPIRAARTLPARPACGGVDKWVGTLRETGADMPTGYRQTACGGLAVDIVEC